MVEMNFIVRPGDVTSERSIGGKAWALSRLAASPWADLVPPWLALTREAFVRSLEAGSVEDGVTPPLAEDVRAALASAVRELLERAESPDGARLAVRSSAVGEDGASSSYAGQLLTRLNVPQDGVEEAVGQVWASAFADHVVHYRRRRGESAALPPAVLIQLMVPAEAAGVAFSRDPLGGDRLVVAASSGLGDRLVSGEVSGETWRLARSGEVLEHQGEDDSLLEAGQLAFIARTAVGLENFFGAPQDVEWAWSGGRLHLLQSRPITTLAGGGAGGRADRAGRRKILWDNSNIVESYSGVTSPLTFSFARYIYEYVYIEFCRFMGVSRETIAARHSLFHNMLGSINGHVYYNLLSWYEWLTLFPGFSLNRRFMEQMMGVGEELPEEFLADLKIETPGLIGKVGEALRLARSGLGLLVNNFLLERKIKAFNRRLDEALATPLEVLNSLPLDELARQYRALESRLLRAWDAPLINDFLCMMAFGLSRRLLEKYGGEAGLAYHRDMLIGQGDIISAEPARRIRAMAEEAAGDEALARLLAGGDQDAIWPALAARPKLEGLVREYLDRFGDRCLQELKLESPTMADEPGTLFSSIGHLALRLAGGGEARPAAEALPPLATVIGAGFWRNLLTERASRWARRLVRNRENLRFERTRLFGRVRRIFTRIGVILAGMGRLAEPGDIFYLQVEEVLGFIEGASVETDPRALAARRREEYRCLAERPDPPSRLVTEGAVFAALAEAAQSGRGGNETAFPPERLKGLACCRGEVTGPVRVITDPRNAELRAGEIMVARFTDPGWITLFANAAGILVERGSLLSHSAIVARELNIPAIVGLAGVTGWLATGDVVRMDGTTGLVERLERASEPPLEPES